MNQHHCGLPADGVAPSLYAYILVSRPSKSREAAAASHSVCDVMGAAQEPLLTIMYVFVFGGGAGGGGDGGGDGGAMQMQ